MALTKLTTELNKISTLATIITGQATTVKGAFDHDVNVVKDYINDTLIPDVENKFEAKDDLTTNRKLSPTGNFTGTWNGKTMVETDPGIQAIVNEHTSQLADIENQVNGYLVNVKYPPLPLVGAAGDGITDDTVAINTIVQYVKTNKLGGIFIPDATFMIKATGLSDAFPAGTVDGGIVIDSSMRVIMHPNATLKAITGNKVGYCILNVRNTSNVLIQGGNIVGERTTHDGTTGEFGYGINIINSSNIKVVNCKISDCWGDGIFLGADEQNNVTYSKDIYINDVSSKNNRRQGLSIVSAKNVHIVSCEFSDTNGTLPEAGIDLEANPGFPDNEDIFISKCIFKNNNKSDIMVTGLTKNVVIDGNTMFGAKGSSVVQIYQLGVNETNGIVISNNMIDGNNTCSNGIQVGGNDVIVKNNKIKNCTLTESSAIYLSNFSVGVACVLGNIINNCRYGVVTDVVAVANAEICNNAFMNILAHGIYTHIALSKSLIVGNKFKTVGNKGINCFDTVNSVLISNNIFDDIQESGLYGDITKSEISNNVFIDTGKANYAAANPSIAISTAGGDNFIIGNRVRNAIVGHVGIRDEVTPSTPNIVSKNDLRYAAASQVLALNAADISDSNFTL